MVEAGVVDGRRAESVVRAYLEPLLAAEPGIDTLLLGCTHYPLLRGPIERIVGERRRRRRLGLHDGPGGRGPARRARCPRAGELEPRPGASRRPAIGRAFLSVAERLFGDELPSVEAVDLEPVTVVPVD